MKLTKTPAFQNLGGWIKGTADFDGKQELKFCAKAFDEPSCYGINEGRISKLEIRLGNKILANFDRGWDIEVPEEAKPLYDWILAQFN